MEAALLRHTASPSSSCTHARACNGARHDNVKLNFKFKFKFKFKLKSPMLAPQKAHCQLFQKSPMPAHVAGPRPTPANL